MAKIILPNRIKISGPWLIDTDQLQQLDSILNEGWESLIQYREERIGDIVECRLDGEQEEEIDGKRAQLKERIENSYEFSRKEKQISTTFKSGKKLISTSISEIISDRNIKDETVEKFEITLICGEIELDLSIGDYSHDLVLTANPISTPIVNNLFVELERWANKFRPSKWLSMWRSFAGFHWYVLFLLMPLCLAFVPDNDAEYKKHLRSEAYGILENGIEQKETQKALEILLSLETNYVPQKWTTNSSNALTKFLIIVTSLFLMSLALSFAPKIHIGLTPISNEKVKRWRIWVKTISITIPSIFFTGIILPFIYENLKNIFTVL